MESVKIKTHIGEDGILCLRLPISNQEIEAMVIYQPIIKQNHQESKLKFERLLQQYKGQTFTDSAELLREDRLSE
jgi:ribosomal protein S16